MKYALDHGWVRIEELRNPERTLHIDSKVLEKAEARIEEAELSANGDSEEEDADAPRRTPTKDEQAERLRTMVDTVGKPGQPGAQIQNVISVGMLSEGWDAKTVTHIMGLRAFSSQLLCEQVVGRGLRRTSYEINPKTGRFEPEYVNIFGAPFTFLPHEGGEGTAAPAQSHKTLVEAVAEKRQYDITWPNVSRSDRLQITPRLFYQDELRRRIVLTLCTTRIVRHIWDAIRQANTEQLVPVLDTEHPLRCTGDMRPWYTGRPCEWTRRSHVDFCVYDSTWEAREAFVLDRHPGVEAWAKNDHLGFDVVYVYDGVMHKYRPDFLVRLANGKMLVLEVKGEDSPQNQAKRAYLKEWCQAVTGHGGFGVWECDVALSAGELRDVVENRADRQ